MIIEPRQYQADDVDYAMNHGRNDKPIHCAPTGSGKTIIQALIAKRELERGDETAILTPRNEIFTQTHGVLNAVVGEKNVGLLRAKREGESWNPIAPVHVVSWHTLISRVKRSEFWFPKVKRVLVDEAHLSMAPKILEVLEYYAPRARIDGYTATPARQTGKGLGRFFTEIKNVTSVRQLIADGHLAPVEYFGGATPNLAGIRTRQGDYEPTPLSNRCIELVGEAVDNWCRLASGRQTIVFTVDIRHCEAVCDNYQRAGISAAALHTGLDNAKRDEVVNDFKSGKIQVLVNVTIASYGFDSPEVSCVQLLAPTKSIVKHLQSIGRGMRPKPDGGECLVLDHAGNVNRLGFADDLFRWRLTDGEKACENWSRNQQSGEEKETKDHECGNCHAIFNRQRICPKCGWELPFAKRDIFALECDLVPIGKSMVKRLPDDWPSHEVFYGMLRAYCMEQGYAQGWAAHKFKEKVGVYPPFEWQEHAAIPPAPRVRNWIRHRQIAYAKGKQKRDSARSSKTDGR